MKKQVWEEATKCMKSKEFYGLNASSHAFLEQHSRTFVHRQKSKTHLLYRVIYLGKGRSQSVS